MMTHSRMGDPAAVGSGGEGWTAVAPARGGAGVPTGDGGGDWKRLKAAAPASLRPTMATTSSAVQMSTSRVSPERATGGKARSFTFSSLSLNCVRSQLEGFKFAGCGLKSQIFKLMVQLDGHHYSRFAHFCQLRVSGLPNLLRLLRQNPNKLGSPGLTDGRFTRQMRLDKALASFRCKSGFWSAGALLQHQQSWCTPEFCTEY